MNISNEILTIARHVCAELEVPDIVGLYLPELSIDGKFRDEFGFVFLADGIAAPFYVSLPGTLANLHARFPDPGQTRLSIRSCLEGLNDSHLANRALAVGAQAANLIG